MSGVSFRDPGIAQLASSLEGKYGLPTGLLVGIITKGEKSNSDQVSNKGARTVAQIIPSTRAAFLKRYGIDAYASQENALEVAALHLRDDLKATGGDVQETVARYHAGPSGKNRGDVNRAYVERVTGGSAYDRAKQARETREEQPSIGKIYSAYKAGAMTPDEQAEFEADVNSGAILLPRGASLLKAAPVPTLPAGVIEAYNTRSDMTDAERDQVDQDIQRGLVKAPGKLTRPAARGGLEAFGAGTRNVLEGATGVVDIVGSPLNRGLNAILPGDPLSVSPGADIGRGVADLLHLPSDQTAGEKFIGSGVRAGAGALAGSGLGGLVSGAEGLTGTVGKAFADAPIKQAIGAVTGGLTAEAAAQSGVGPVGQLVAGVAGGAGGFGAANLAEAATRLKASPKVAAIVENVPREEMVTPEGQPTPEAIERAGRAAVTPEEIVAAYVEKAAPPRQASADPYSEYPIAKNPDRSTWDKRADGSDKGTGFLGLRQRPDGGVSSEISVGVNFGGQEIDIPTMVPGLTQAEMRWLMTSKPDAGAMPRSIIDKAVAHAKERMAQGLSPFKQASEGDFGTGAPERPIVTAGSPDGETAVLTRPEVVTAEAAPQPAPRPAPEPQPIPEAPLAGTAKARFDEAQTEGVTLSRGEAEQNFSRQVDENTLRNSQTDAGEQARQFKETQQGDIQASVSRFREAFGNPEATPEERGALVQQATRELRDQGKAGVDALYATARDMADQLGDNSRALLDLDTTALQAQVKELLVDPVLPSETRAALREVAAQNGLLGRNPLTLEDGTTHVSIMDSAGKARDTIKLPRPVDRLNVSNAERLRSDVNALYKPTEPASGRILPLKHLIDDAVSAAVDRAASQGVGDVGKAFKDARGAFQKQAQTFQGGDLIEAATKWKRGETGTFNMAPEQVIAKIFSGGKDSVANLRRFKAVLLGSPTEATRAAWTTIQAHGIAEVFGKSFDPQTGNISGARMTTAIERLGRNKLKILLNDDEFNQLMKIERVTRNATVKIPGTFSTSGSDQGVIRFLAKQGAKLGGAVARRAPVVGPLVDGAAAMVQMGRQAAKEADTLAGMADYTPKAETSAKAAPTSPRQFVADYIEIAGSPQLIAATLGAVSQREPQD